MFVRSCGRRKKKQNPANPPLTPKSILSGCRRDLHDKKQSNLRLQQAIRPQRLTANAKSSSTTAGAASLSPSINSVFPLKKKRNLQRRRVAPSAYPVFRQSDGVRWKTHHRRQRAPNPVIGFTLSHNLRSVHF